MSLVIYLNTGLYTIFAIEFCSRARQIVNKPSTIHGHSMELKIKSEDYVCPDALYPKLHTINYVYW